MFVDVDLVAKAGDSMCSLPFFLLAFFIGGVSVKSKFYAVAVGRAAGVYTDWPTAERQVKGFAGAKFKSFSTKQEAIEWCDNPVYASKEKKATGSKKTLINSKLPTSGADDCVIVYTDGGCSGNPGPGGYGVVILDGELRIELSGGFRLTTNNRMEMMACIVALQQLVATEKCIRIYSDSSYLVNGITKGWAKGWRSRGWRKSDGQPAVNSDLWENLLNLFSQKRADLIWVKGHAGHELNERCDQLAVAAFQGLDLAVDQEYETK